MGSDLEFRAHPFAGRHRAPVAGRALLAFIALTTLLGPFAIRRDPARQYADANYAPPMLPHLMDDRGAWHRPFVYPIRLEDRLQRRYVEVRDDPRPIRWMKEGRVASIDESAGPWLLLGGDALGRDIFARLLVGARYSLGVAALAVAGALLLGALLGATAGFFGGWTEDLLMRLADLVLVLPAIYVVLVLRAAMPLVLSTREVFWTMTAVMAVAGWPYVARGVRAIVAAERGREYAEAAKAMGAGPLRILLRHLLPATFGFLVVQATLLLPAFVLAEATLSFVGLGFPEPTPSWGLMLQDASAVGSLTSAPWLLAPAAAIALSVLAFQLASTSVAKLRSSPRLWT